MLPFNNQKNYNRKREDIEKEKTILNTPMNIYFITWLSAIFVFIIESNFYINTHQTLKKIYISWMANSMHTKYESTYLNTHRIVSLSLSTDTHENSATNAKKYCDAKSLYQYELRITIKQLNHKQINRQKHESRFILKFSA